MKKTLTKEQQKKRYKLIYCGELMFFAIVFLVLGILDILGVITPSEKRHLIFNWVTICAVPLFFVWTILTLSSKKRRASSSVMDKLVLVPVEIYVLVYDILCFSGKLTSGYSLFQGLALTYIGAIYLFESFFHYHVPNPELKKVLDEIDHPSDENPEAKAESTDSVEENKTDDAGDGNA